MSDLHLGAPYAADDYPKGEVPAGTYAREQRSPIVWVRLCAGCAGFAPFTAADYAGQLSGNCVGCGRRSRELHRFRAFIDSASGCSCETHGQAFTGDLRAIELTNPAWAELCAVARAILDRHYPADVPVLCDPHASAPGPRLVAALHDVLEVERNRTAAS